MSSCESDNAPAKFWTEEEQNQTPGPKPKKDNSRAHESRRAAARATRLKEMNEIFEERFGEVFDRHYTKRKETKAKTKKDNPDREPINLESPVQNQIPVFRSAFDM